MGMAEVSSKRRKRTKTDIGCQSSAIKKIKEMFDAVMPEDFYDFWAFCEELNPKNPEDALMDTMGLQLVGPYDVLTGKLDGLSESSYHLHWRYYYDPPEFMTVIRGNEDQGFHIGYYRDEPQALPVFVASNKAKVSCEMSVIGENLFSALNTCITENLKKIKDKSQQSSLKKMQTSLITKAKELQYSLATTTPAIKARNKKVNSKTLHKAGIVVPVNAMDVGYRPLTVTDAELKKMLKTITESENKSAKDKASDELQELLTFVQFANDEGDYGMGLELGLDLFCFGSKQFHNTILQLLPLAYQLLGREKYAKIIQEHLENRDREKLSEASKHHHHHH
nr:Chain A, Predicted protein [Nematostella vectensis]6TX1_B Chain B, Predicted protein [Nematostella vectensis]